MPRINRGIINIALSNNRPLLDETFPIARSEVIKESYIESSEGSELDSWEVTEEEHNLIMAMASPYHEIILKIIEIKRKQKLAPTDEGQLNTSVEQA